MKSAFALILVLICCCSVRAGRPTDGNSLLARCDLALKPQQTEAESLDAVWLLGYVDGFEGGVLVASSEVGAPAPFDIPADVTAGQRVRVIKKWLEDHPAELHKHYALLIWMAFRDTFPMKKE